VSNSRVCPMVFFHTKNSICRALVFFHTKIPNWVNFWNGECWCILWPFGIVCSNWVFIFPIWNVGTIKICQPCFWDSKHF
jgi:hypothetical protein